MKQHEALALVARIRHEMPNVSTKMQKKGRGYTVSALLRAGQRTTKMHEPEQWPSIRTVWSSFTSVRCSRCNVLCEPERITHVPVRSSSPASMETVIGYEPVCSVCVKHAKHAI